MAIEHRLHACCGGGHAAVARFGRPFSFASTSRVYERDRPFLVRHLALDVALEVASKSISAMARLEVERIAEDADVLVLDAVGFEMGPVTVDGRTLDAVYDGQVLRVPVERSVRRASIAVQYRAKPRKGLYFLSPDDHVPDRPRQVWTQCQDEDARYWFPCHDKPHVRMTTEVRVQVPSGWFALSNGELHEALTEPGASHWTYHWKMQEPHASYLVTLVAGEFSEVTDEGPVPIQYLVPKGKEADGRRAFGQTPAMMKLVGELTGVPYPWNKYAQVVVKDFVFGGMENTTATTMYEHVLLDERASIDISSDDIVMHELAHQWFGDYVTCRDWSEGWLNEGFATYLEHVWREHHLGPDEYLYSLKVDMEAYLHEAHGRYRRPIVCQDYEAPIEIFDRHLYQKGGLVLHMLRTELGASVFWRGVHVYLVRHAKGIVETRDLIRALEEVSGRSLGRFFEQWVYRPGHPEWDVELTWDKGILQVHVRQHHGAVDGVPNAFEAPLILDVACGGRVRRERLSVTQRQEVFSVHCETRPEFIVVDPEMHVIGSVKVKAPEDMSRAQLSKAPTARGRWLAAMALSRSDDPVTIAVLSARLKDEGEFWGVRAECAEALASIRSTECEEALVEALTVAHPKVRRAVVGALGAFRTVKALEALRPKALSDPSYLVEAEAARSLGRTRQPGAFDVLVDILDRPSWAEVIRAGVSDGFAALRDERAIPHLVARTRYGHPERARRAAVRALPKISGDRKTRELLEDLLDDAHPHLRADAIHALLDLGDPRCRGALRARLDVELDGGVRRRIREALRDIGGEGKNAVRELRDEMEKTGSELAELRARLGKLEARFGAVPTEKKVPAGGESEANPEGGREAKQAATVRGGVGKKSSRGSRKAGRRAGNTKSRG